MPKDDKFYASLKKIKEKADAKEMELIDLIASAYEKAQETKERAVEKVKDTAACVNNSVHLHPWCYIGSAAICGFLMGLLLHKRH